MEGSQLIQHPLSCLLHHQCSWSCSIWGSLNPNPKNPKSSLGLRMRPSVTCLSRQRNNQIEIPRYHPEDNTSVTSNKLLFYSHRPKEKVGNWLCLSAPYVIFICHIIQTAHVTVEYSKLQNKFTLINSYKSVMGIIY